MDTVECINAIMFHGDPAIRLDQDTVNPNKVAHDAMKYVPDFFEEGKVCLKRAKRRRHIWFLEINRN
jgi:hypothetical protein